MSKFELVSSGEAQEYVDKEDSPTILIKYTDDTREVETSREIIVTSEEQSRRNSNNFDYRLAHTVIAQSEQIKRLQAAVNELLPEYNRLDMAEQQMEEPHEEPRGTSYQDLGLEWDDMP